MRKSSTLQMYICMCLCKNLVTFDQLHFKQKGIENLGSGLSLFLLPTFPLEKAHHRPWPLFCLVIIWNRLLILENNKAKQQSAYSDRLFADTSALLLNRKITVRSINRPHSWRQEVPILKVSFLACGSRVQCLCVCVWWKYISCPHPSQHHGVCENMDRNNKLIDDVFFLKTSPFSQKTQTDTITGCITGMKLMILCLCWVNSAKWRGNRTDVLLGRWCVRGWWDGKK